MPPKVVKRSLKKTSPKPENRQFIVRYKCDNMPLSDEQKKRLMRNIKKEHYYHTYLSGKFKFSFADSENCTVATYLWKGGAGDWREAGERVPALLTGDFDVLPDGVTAKLVSSKEV